MKLCFLGIFLRLGHIFCIPGAAFGRILVVTLEGAQSDNLSERILSVSGHLLRPQKCPETPNMCLVRLSLWAPSKVTTKRRPKGAPGMQKWCPRRPKWPKNHNFISVSQLLLQILSLLGWIWRPLGSIWSRFGSSFLGLGFISEPVLFWSRLWDMF